MRFIRLVILKLKSKFKILLLLAIKIFNDIQVIEENSSRLLAIKCVNLSSVEESTANGYLNEIELLSKLQGCSSVIKMFDQ